MGKHPPIETVEVMVGGRKVSVPRTLKVSELRRITQIPSHRALVVQNSGSSRILKDHDIVDAEYGDIFYDVPEYDVGSEGERILLDLYLLQQAYRIVKYDRDRLLWVLIQDFDLPPGYNKHSSELLVELPRNYPFGPPCNFFLDRSIKTEKGKSIQHYYPGRQYNKYYDKGWAWFCITFKNWKVREDIMESDNLLTCVELAYLTLKQLVS
jgi:hypothetical protein